MLLAPQTQGITVYIETIKIEKERSGENRRKWNRVSCSKFNKADAIKIRNLCLHKQWVEQGSKIVKPLVKMNIKTLYFLEPPVTASLHCPGGMEAALMIQHLEPLDGINDAIMELWGCRVAVWRATGSKRHTGYVLYDHMTVSRTEQQNMAWSWRGYNMLVA